MKEQTYYLPVRLQAGREPLGWFSPGRAAGWLTLVATAVLVAFSAFVSWRWVETHILSVGVQDAGEVTVNHAELLERVRAFELITVKETYDTSSHTDFEKRLNAGVTRIGLPGWMAGQELNVRAKVTVAAGADLAQVLPENVEIIQQGANAVVIVRIPAAQIMSVEIDPESFDISTKAGILTRVRRSIGLQERDVRDGAVSAVTAVAREEALRSGILRTAAFDARTRLQAFLQSLPQIGGTRITYLVEEQARLPLQ